MNIELTTEEEDLIHCNFFTTVERISHRTGQPVNKVSSILVSQLKRKYNMLCPGCGSLVCVEDTGNRCMKCDSLIKNVYPISVQDKLEQLIREVDDPFVDNERIAMKSDSKEVELYKRCQSEGCCGFVDEEFIAPEDDEVYLIGFNYGH